MRWEDLMKPNGLEIDEFDDQRALHMLYLEGEAVLGYQRMLPSTQPHRLSEVLSDLCDDDRPVGHHIWEWRRYCVAKPHRERGRILSPVANALLSAIVRWGMDSGVSEVIIEMDPLWLLRLVQLHFHVTPLGIPKRVGNSDVVAVTAAFDRRTLARLREMRRNDTQVSVSQPSVIGAVMA